MENIPFDIEKLNFEIENSAENLLSYGESELEEEVKHTAQKIFFAKENVKIALSREGPPPAKPHSQKKLAKSFASWERTQYIFLSMIFGWD